MTITFDDFFRGIWQYDPYNWQSDLSRQVHEEGWPDLLDIPTGAGKTAVLDIALYHFLSTGGSGAPRRMIVVVDRRIIVDQVAQRAARIRDSIEAGRDGGALADAYAALRGLVGEDAPLLHAQSLRGGQVRTDAWASSPHAPVLAASTVDQVGSRLLFRGYGVSERMRPIHAGLLGCDTILFLDEVHLARPFADTLQQLGALRRGGEGAGPNGLRVVELSATPGRQSYAARTTFRIGDRDRNEALSRVLNAAKPATLERVAVRTRDREDTKRQAVAAAAARHAVAMMNEGRHAVAVIVNRVDTARRTWQELSSNDAFDVRLLTGRMRPLDQAKVLDDISPRVGADRAPPSDARPIIVVATQCIEAGADYDFDGMVTEVASLDALRQRFGRMDRRGEQAGRHARGVILGRSDLLTGEDPVYGAALARTWDWLTGMGASIDFGIVALEPNIEKLGDRIVDLTPEVRPAPVLLPAYMDQWAQTSPPPHADPDPALFLHGIPATGREALEDVRVIWRADVDEGILARARARTRSADGDEGRHGDGAGRNALRELVEHVALVPPASLEAVGLPVWTFIAWLTGHDSGDDPDIADVEGAAPTPEPDRRVYRRLVLVWSGSRAGRVVDASEVRPGETVIVPAAYGGIGHHLTFDPMARYEVPDVGDAAQLRQRAVVTLRLDNRVHPLDQDDYFDRLTSLVEDSTDRPSVLREILASLRGMSKADPGLAEAIASLGARTRLATSPLGTHVLIDRLRGTPGSRSAGAPSLHDATDLIGGALALDTEPETFIGIERALYLDVHLDSVSLRAADFAARIGLDQALTAAVRWAGLLHDVGKADPRFQHMVYGDDVGAQFGQPLAKSPVRAQDVRAVRDVRRRARYPRGQRHELVSLDMIENSPDLRARAESDGADWDLVLHLVASHHGWCRPMAPSPVMDNDEGESVRFDIGDMSLAGNTKHDRQRLGSGVVDRFHALNVRYGHHGLAFLEAILRLADHTVSAEAS
jgi:CRISPR-associated endonuclease/helicase Cas3